MNSGPVDTVTPVEQALAAAEGAVIELITVLRAGGLDHHDLDGLLIMWDRTEVMRNQWQAVDVEVLAACRDRRVAERECQRSMAKVLERRCLVGPGEARRRMLAAEAAGPRETPTGMPLQRLRGEVSVAMERGVITAQQVVEVNKTLDQLDRADLDPDQLVEVESELVAHCRRFGPKELKTLCQRYLDAFDPDGPEPDGQRSQDLRSWTMHTTSSGAVVGQFRLTPETGAKARAIFSSLSNPRVDTATGLTTADHRSHPQRQHDAFDDLCSRALRAGGLPDSGGTPATVIVTIDHTDLLHDLARAGIFTQPVPYSPCPACGGDNATRPPGDPDPGEVRSGDRSLGPSKGKPHRARPSTSSGNETPTTTGTSWADSPAPAATNTSEGSPDDRSLSPSKGKPHPARPSTSSGNETRAGRRRWRARRGVTSDGIALTVPELLKLAGEAEIYPVVLAQSGRLLDLGRSRRIANKHQTLALIARDGGCSFPGCDNPPEWCERHHVRPWSQNGKTDLRNLTLLCSYHHRHFLDHGWQVRINTDGLPEWVPPRYLDRAQTPMINNRIVARMYQPPLAT